jgi:opacity protein-like surface antigen
MRHPSHAILLAVAAVSLATSTASAQRLASRAIEPRAPRHVDLQQPSARTNPTVTLMGGLATGDNNLDVGLFFGASFGWDIRGTPLDIRFDPSLSRYGGGGVGYDASMLQLGIPAAVEYQFKTTGRAKPYVMGGIGLYYSRYSYDVSTPGLDVGVSDSNTELGIAIGGGVRLNSRFGLEGRIIDVDAFTTIPLLLTWRL